MSAVKYARYLGMVQPVYGLQPLGFEEGLVPHNRVEDMAAYYIKEIRSLQPEGPYYLGNALEALSPLRWLNNFKHKLVL
ncbi:MAG: thioesterase domain-containing protein [Pseudomonadota bacterium]